jgi:hypothetical protein
MTGPTQTSHEPTPDELEGHATTDPSHHPGDVAGEPHGPDDHAHAGEALGPVDVQAWGALVLGVAAGLVVALCLVISLGLSPKIAG